MKAMNSNKSPCDYKNIVNNFNNSTKKYRTKVTISVNYLNLKLFYSLIMVVN